MCCSLVVACCTLLAVMIWCLVFVGCGLLLVARCLCVVCCSLSDLSVWRYLSLFVFDDLLFVARCLLFVVVGCRLSFVVCFLVVVCWLPCF